MVIPFVQSDYLRRHTWLLEFALPEGFAFAKGFEGR